jgi:phosphopentomutase
MSKRAIILVMDSFGLGATPDAVRFGDEDADTLGPSKPPADKPVLRRVLPR